MPFLECKMFRRTPMSRSVLPCDPLSNFLYLFPLRSHSAANQTVLNPIACAKSAAICRPLQRRLTPPPAPYYRCVESFDNSFLFGGAAMAEREFLSGDARQRERAYSPAVKVKGGTTLY